MALTHRLRQGTDELLVRENRDPPDALNDIAAPMLVPDG
jgi:hypothetical protein